MVWHLNSEVIEDEIEYLLSEDTDTTVLEVLGMARDMDTAEGKSPEVNSQEGGGPPHIRLTYDFEIIYPDDYHPCGLSPEQLESLPTKAFEGNSFLTTCSVCLATFSNGDLLRHLPCTHNFHVECIDQWLFVNSTCPVCRSVYIEIKDQKALVSGIS
uniref:RING-type domain-containing protein n=1 Tax=Erpetoichthys calabaricus TaxID=27687 RepID=A0A8C4RCI4_ERPCA